VKRFWFSFAHAAFQVRKRAASSSVDMSAR